jgi:hypothetical protein
MDPCVARARGNRGAALVEAAFVLPLLILLAFAVIEFGFTFKDLLTVTSATRAGARTATALSKRPNYQSDTADAVAGVLKNTMPTRGIQYLVVYKANPNTGRPADGASFEQCNVCYRYKWAPKADGGAGAWIRNGGNGWPAKDQNACGDAAHTDYLGVYVRARHDFITGLFGRTATLTDHTVMRLEPVPSENGCRAS